MTPVSFLIALAALSIGTYAMRFAGVKLGAAIATRGRRRQLTTTSVGAGESVGSANPDYSSSPGDSTASGEPEGDSTATVTKWMDRATVVLIGAVFATTAIFDGQDLADPARLIGVGVGVLASILRAPMLICVLVGMGVCAAIRMTGVL
ncbi:MAG: AzlD domain-containing protein [Brevibacterium sp.]|uniref:AzlD domain-containing protein n=1 Tax=Brevibacterium sp. TaxID=1701 RepID=UPI00264829C3|nr:AzlD domain-containing protein [Brevibacterium sp.]MDN5807989.1 AzlD domain-containing protein [Brevibacterium sp.]MDN5834794.1 AzlD domain-containing protein [Brevibacterium sp.]MDN5876848.1 AzlD domain-containing protein [Brevibacterium sp.]MDN5910153.1 AzlD domain-containing protein [Brevibacterium sp.]MDN6123633.1 AzlD domain-containing protein [Brevibacterium sp.]